VIKVNPFRCRMWEMHDRLDTHITEESCKAEIESFLKYGQLVPVLGRYIRGDSNHDIVLVYGARRLFVARHLNQPLSVEVRELTDREAIIAADLENRQRTDVSPYERGLSYARWLEAGHFKSQDDIARALKISAAQVSRLLKLASLPKEVVAAFAHTADIHERWGRTLMKVMSNPHAARLTLGKAAAIRKLPQRPPRQEVYRELLTAAVGERRAALASKAEVVKDHGGTRLFRVKRQSNSVVILLPLATVCASRLEHIRREVTRILQEEKHLLGEPIAVPRHPFAKRDADVTACIRGEAT
jgi:ParB family chromosome partitioning protein